MAQTLPLKMGAEDVTLRTYGEAVAGNVVGADGGTVADDAGDRIDLPAGAVADPTAVTLTRKTPADLPLDIRVAISREAALARRPRFSGFAIRLENALNAFAIPATGGLVTAVIMFSLFMGFLTLPPALQANDVPLTFYTEPVLRQTPYGLGALSDDSLVIEAYVDSNGRVQDYRVLSNPQDKSDLPSQVKNMLIFTTFRPATSMGQPTSGRAVLSFSKISVKG